MSGGRGRGGGGVIETGKNVGRQICAKLLQLGMGKSDYSAGNCSNCPSASIIRKGPVMR